MALDLLIKYNQDVGRFIDDVKKFIKTHIEILDKTANASHELFQLDQFRDALQFYLPICYLEIDEGKKIIQEYCQDYHDVSQPNQSEETDSLSLSESYKDCIELENATPESYVSWSSDSPDPGELKEDIYILQSPTILLDKQGKTPQDASQFDLCIQQQELVLALDHIDTLQIIIDELAKVEQILDGEANKHLALTNTTPLIDDYHAIISQFRFFHPTRPVLIDKETLGHVSNPECRTKIAK